MASDENPENPFGVKAENPGHEDTELAKLKLEVNRLAEIVNRGEFVDLTETDRLRTLILAEIQQRIRMRRLAAFLGVIIIGFMCYTIVHISHTSMPPWWWPYKQPLSTSLAIAMFLAPVASITAITISLLFGVFRRFKDDDLQIDKAGLAGEVVKSQFGG